MTTFSNSVHKFIPIRSSCIPLSLLAHLIYSLVIIASLISCRVVSLSSSGRVSGAVDLEKAMLHLVQLSRLTGMLEFDYFLTTVLYAWLVSHHYHAANTTHIRKHKWKSLLP